MATATQAQIFLGEGEDNMRANGDAPTNIWPVLPNDNAEGEDGYSPIGDGILLLAALGGAYLVRKRKNHTNPDPSL